MICYDTIRGTGTRFLPLIFGFPYNEPQEKGAATRADGIAIVYDNGSGNAHLSSFSYRFSMNVPSSPSNASNDVSPDVSTLSPVYARYAWFVLVWNLFVIIIGTVVRATRSGDGCGAHWPLCDGEYLPTAPSIARIIEYTHRLVSGVDGILVIALVAGGFFLLRHQKGHPLKPALVGSLVFTFVEAWIGKYLVNKGLVAHNATIARAIWMALHLTNTFFLLTALTLSAWFASGKARLEARTQGAIGYGLLFAFLAMMVLGASGSVTALGDTLFPVRDHADAIAQSLSPHAHFLQKLRVLHPYIAGSVGLYILLISGLTAHLRPSADTKRYATALAALFVTQILIGSVNVWLKAPVLMQIIHLLVGDIVVDSGSLFNRGGIRARRAAPRSVRRRAACGNRP